MEKVRRMAFGKVQSFEPETDAAWVARAGVAAAEVEGTDDMIRESSGRERQMNGGDGSVGATAGTREEQRLDRQRESNAQRTNANSETYK